MTVKYTDFFRQDLNFGDWVEIARTSSGSYFRFGRVESIGTTGKLLLRVVHAYYSLAGFQVEIGKHRVPYGPNKMHLMRKVDFSTIPVAIQEVVNQSEYV